MASYVFKDSVAGAYGDSGGGIGHPYFLVKENNNGRYYHKWNILPSKIRNEVSTRGQCVMWYQ